MAVNNERSMNRDLMLGATEKTWHQVTPDRGGQVELGWPLWRAANVLKASWGKDQLAEAAAHQANPASVMFDNPLRDRVSIVTGPTARTRPVARNQFEATPYPSPLDAVHTSWPDRW
jgi:hypothetical protein